MICPVLTRCGWQVPGPALSDQRFASGPCCDFDGSLCAPRAVMNDVRPDGRGRRKDLISRSTGRNVTMSGWIKIGVEFITALAHQWKGSSHPNPPSETTDSMAAEELAPGVDSVAVRPESQISIKPEAFPNQQEIERRREIVRQFFNDFWMSTDDKPRTFAERLNRAEGRINERLAEKPT